MVLWLEWLLAEQEDMGSIPALSNCVFLPSGGWMEPDMIFWVKFIEFGPLSKRTVFEIKKFLH